MAGLLVVLYVDATFTSGGAATLQAVLQDSANDSAYTDVLALTPALPLSSLGQRRAPLAHMRLPGRLRRYTRVVWRVAGAAMNSGTITVRTTMNGDLQQVMPSGFAL